MDLPADPKLWPDDPLDRDLVLDLRLDCDTGRMLPDWSEYKNDGAITGLTWETTPYGPALYMDTTSKYVTIPDRDILDGMAMLTVEILLYTTGAQPGDYMRVMTKGYGETWYLGFWTVAANYFTFAVDNGIVNRTANSPTGAQSAGLHHVVGVYDGANVICYRNAVPGTPNAQTGNVDTNAKNVYLGADAAGGYNPDGYLLHARIYYNRALTAPEVAARYQLCTARASGAKSLWMIPFIIEDVGVVTYTITAAAQAVLKMAATATAAGKAILKETYSKTAAGQAWVQDRTTNTAAGQAILKELYSKTAAAQAWLQDRITNTAAGQAFLQMAATATAAGQAVLKMSASATAAGQAVLKEAYSKTAAGQAYLVDISADKTAAMRAILKEAYSKTAAAQAWLQDRITTSAAGQAVLKEAVGAANALQAYLVDVGVGTGLSAMKAVLKEAYSKSAAAQAVLKMAASATSAIQAYLQDRSTLSAAIRAIIKGTMTPIAAMQAYLGGVVVTSDMEVPPRDFSPVVPARQFTMEVQDRAFDMEVEKRA